MIFLFITITRLLINGLDCRQVVQLNGIRSDVRFIKNGVPEGSVLGPLFFIMYLNDFSSSFKANKIILGVDDTMIHQ